MFRLEKIVLLSDKRKKEYSFEDTTFIYGKNSVWKTLLVQCINFLLGDRDFPSNDGLENITDLEAYIVNKKNKLWVKRNLNSEIYYYKRCYDDKYATVSRSVYLNEIGKCISTDIGSEQLKIYRTAFDEKPTYRSFAFLNFISEDNQGDFKQIFTDGKEIKNAVRIRNIMSFFFNYSNIAEIAHKKDLLNNKQQEVDRLIKQQEKYNYVLKNLKSGFNKLGLKYNKEYSENIKVLQNYKREFKREAPSNNNDLIYLSRMSFSLAEEIKQYSFLRQQSAKARERKSNDEDLLELLNSLIIKDKKNYKYIASIQKAIEDIQRDRNILSLSDYDKAIEEIKEKKDRIDTKIAQIAPQAQELDYDEARKQIVILDKMLKDFADFTGADNLNSLIDEIKDLRKSIRELQGSFDKRKLKEFNDKLLKMYLSNISIQNIDYVRDDSKEDGFAVQFDPFKQQLSVEKYTSVDPLKNEIKNKDKVLISFIPGSQARRIHIQMLFYILMLEYVIKEFKGMKILPLLVIDSGDQAIENKNFDILYPQLLSYAEKVGIQLIFISKNKPDGVNKSHKIINLESGLNSYR